jgi:ATP-dependent RNA helicase DeaD
MSSSPAADRFDALGLSPSIQKTLAQLGYEIPTPVQAECIPRLLAGEDLIGQAQTGTGKTAAFALPFIQSLDVTSQVVQLLVLTPTRELAIQVAEAFKTYSRGLKDFHVLPIYGGQAYDNQLRLLKRGVQVVVGTPGRVMDHIDRKTLKLDKLKALVLDEADEMLRMGFIEDVEWILGHTPDKRQIALFSATMPEAIRKIAETYLHNPSIVKIRQQKKEIGNIAQSYLQVTARQKIDALTRILESIEMDASIIFVRTRNTTVELAEKLDARGYAVAALNGDIPQAQRERSVEQLKRGKLDIIVATDVAARGLDVPRISHVINYDVPTDNETYVHRIGRTGRAGRKGSAILLVTPRERRLIKGLERTTGQPMEVVQMPTVDQINLQRQRKFHQRLQQTLEQEDLSSCFELVQSFAHDTETDPMKIAAGLAKLLQGDTPLLLNQEFNPGNRLDRRPRAERDERPDRRPRTEHRDRSAADERSPRNDRPIRYEPKPLKEFPDVPMRRYRIAVGHNDDIKPGNIVGAIANEAELDSCYIGSVDIYDDFTLVDLPDGMPPELIKILKKARVAGKPMGLSTLDSERSANAGKGQPHRGKQPGNPRSTPATRPKHQKRKGKPVRNKRQG